MMSGVVVMVTLCNGRCCGNCNYRQMPTIVADVNATKFGVIKWQMVGH